MKNFGDTPFSCLPTRRRYQTPLKPSKLQNIGSVRQQSQNSKSKPEYCIKISQSIILAKDPKAKGCNTHLNSTFQSTPIRQTSNESMFDRILKDTNVRIAHSMMPDDSRVNHRYQYISVLQDADSQSADKSEYVILPRDTYEQLLRNDWVCSEVVPPSLPQALNIRKPTYKF